VSAHDPALPPDPESSSWEAIKAWRKQARDVLIARRVALASHIRRARGEQAKRRLTETVDLRQYETLGIYWPIRGEIDIRDLAREHVARGGRIGLPVVVTRSAPVEFWSWTPGSSMGRGLWDIPIPRERVVVHPEALIVPLVGFDGSSYRLGYGGGYYDRTIAAAEPRPFCIGFGYAESRLATIWPQAHDMRMDIIVTDAPE
jgi:5-formyltetrahydrofolate cyclo-ligase